MHTPAGRSMWDYRVLQGAWALDEDESRRRRRRFVRLLRSVCVHIVKGVVADHRIRE